MTFCRNWDTFHGNKRWTMDRNLLHKYDRSVPRYTSYPTAPHFKAELTSADYARILSGIPEGKGISLYVHIPFCRHLCFYCACNTKIIDHNAPIAEYLGTVRKEVELTARAIGRRQRVTHIHFGGGTPNFAAAKDLAALLEVIGSRFDLADDLVTAMEIDPRLLTQDMAGEIAALGVNRISFGVQDFHPEVQKAINRIQPFEMVQDSTAWLRAAGIRSVNYDMIYGLPLQTVEIMRESIALAVQLRPERIALFGYAHVPWFKEHQKKLEAFSMPDTAARFDMAEAARADLLAAGYVPVGIDHFALPQDELAKAAQARRLRRNFQGYTTDGEVILAGFGQTSISGYVTAYAQNTDRNIEYRDRVQAGEFPVVRGCFLSAEDVYRRAAIEQVMCYGEVKLAALPGAGDFADKVWAEARESLILLEADGLVTLKDRALSVTAAGQPFTRVVASRFDAYLPPETAAEAPLRHAKAI